MTDCLFSDHSTLICDLTLDKPLLPKEKISFRKTKVVDVNLLCDELSTTSVCTDSPDALNDTVKCYNSTLSAVLDRHAPLVTKFITVRPWYLGLVKILGGQGGKDGELIENGVDLEVSVICLNLKRRGTLLPT